MGVLHGLSHGSQFLFLVNNQLVGCTERWQRTNPGPPNNRRALQRQSKGKLSWSLVKTRNDRAKLLQYSVHPSEKDLSFTSVVAIFCTYGLNRSKGLLNEEYEPMDTFIEVRTQHHQLLSTSQRPDH